MSNKLPPFLVSKSRVKDREFIIYTKEPIIIFEVFIYKSEEAKHYPVITEYKGFSAVLLLVSKLDEGININGITKRLGDWYHGILQDKVKNNEL